MTDHHSTSSNIIPPLIWTVIGVQGLLLMLLLSSRGQRWLRERVLSSLLPSVSSSSSKCIDDKGQDIDHHQKLSLQNGKSTTTTTDNTNMTPVRVLLLIAHPDDECMFFAPTCLFFTNPTSESHFHFSILCLSRGNAEGLGDVRERELAASARTLGITNVHVIEDPELQDNSEAMWRSEKIASVIKLHAKSHPFDMIITFDEQGISGHLNHIAAYAGARYYIFQALADQPHLRLFTLRTILLARKYSGLWDIGYSMLDSLFPPSAWWHTYDGYKAASPLFILSPIQGYLTGRSAMFQHQSQLLWFRYLYLIFSRYMYMNELWEVSVKPDPEREPLDDESKDQ